MTEMKGIVCGGDTSSEFECGQLRLSGSGEEWRKSQRL